MKIDNLVIGKTGVSLVETSLEFEARKLAEELKYYRSSGVTLSRSEVHNLIFILETFLGRVKCEN